MTSLNVTNVDGALRLSWDVKDQQLRGCADRFRITVDDQDSGELTDIFVNDKFLDLGFVSPCVEYEFGVRALFNSRPTQEGPLTAIDYDVPPVSK